MRIIVYGAGGVGSAIGGLLHRAGKETLLICRPGHAGAINKDGLKITTPNEIFTVRVPAVTHPDQIQFRQDDVIFLTVKSQQTEAALKELKLFVKDIPVFCFQNGVRNEETASQHFPRVYGVLVNLGVVFMKDGEVTIERDPSGFFVIGRYPTGTDELIEQVAGALRPAGFPVLVSPDVMPYKWGKLSVNLVNAIGAITNGRDDEENAKVIAKAAKDELYAMIELAGIKLISFSRLGREWADNAAPVRKSLDIESRWSTWQSLARQTGSVETEYMNGEIVRLAKKLGKTAPVNEALLRITEEMAAKHEKPGKYTTQELRKMLGV